MPHSRITLQHLVPPVGIQPIEARDAQFADSIQISPPPAILLDYMYGAAAYRRWGARESMDGLMQHRFLEYYKPIPLPPRSPSSSESDDSHDGNYDLRRRRHHSRSDMSPKMLQAMDNILRPSTWLKGTTPEAIAAEREEEGGGRVACTESWPSEGCSPTCVLFLVKLTPCQQTLNV
jgi:hypothetical protein